MPQTFSATAMTHRLFSAAAVGVLTVAMTGCATTGQEAAVSEGTRKGAIAGAAVGLTMGALAGSPELAAKGAVLGGVTGGATGMLADYGNDRQDYRAETIAGGLAGKQPAATSSAAPTNASWDDIDKLVGTWRVDVWGYDANGDKVTAQATAEGKLLSTRSIDMSVHDFQSGQTDATIQGHTVLSFDPQNGYEMVNRYSTSEQDQRYVGEYVATQNRYQYYYAGHDVAANNGLKRSDYRLDMRFVGNDVIIIDTWVQVDGNDVQVQSYRFTRLS